MSNNTKKKSSLYYIIAVLAILFGGTGAELGIKEGDKLEVIEKDGIIQLVPVVVYPKHYVEDLKTEIDDIKAKVAAGTQPVFDDLDSLFDALER